jgi:asparagine synthase (glutamine-hydrolysing)
MYAFAAWDRQSRNLFLVRDRVGEKPLYFGVFDRTLYFASELRAVELGIGSSLTIDRRAVAALLQLSYIPAPYSIYQGIRKLEPATILTVKRDEQSGVISYYQKRYWQLPPSGSRAARTLAAATDELEALLTNSVRQQMVADVPVGAFLSGGVDSSAVVGLMQHVSASPVHTFTVGFQDALFDESRFAREAAEFLGTTHTEIILSADEASLTLRQLPGAIDEPFADSSQLPTYLVSKVARRDVTVCLSGDGGDELFGGYPRYELGADLWRRMARVPFPVRRALGSTLQTIAPAGFDSVLHWLKLAGIGRNVSGHRLHRLARAIGARSIAELYTRLVSQWHTTEESVVLGSRDFFEFPFDSEGGLPNIGTIEHMRRADFAYYLPDDIMTKVDRASMAVSLETRAPLLDHRIVEFAFTLQEDLLIQDGITKRVLRALAERYVPPSVFDRPKAGFGIPVGEWLRGRLRPWAEAMLDQERLARQGLLDPVPIGKLWRQHLAGSRDRQAYLWPVLMLQAWMEARGR